MSPIAKIIDTEIKRCKKYCSRDYDYDKYWIIDWRRHHTIYTYLYPIN